MITKLPVGYNLYGQGLSRPNGVLIDSKLRKCKYALLLLSTRRRPLGPSLGTVKLREGSLTALVLAGILVVSGWQSTSSLVTRSEAASTLSSKLESAGLSRESANTRSTSAWRIHCWVQLLQSEISIQ